MSRSYKKAILKLAGETSLKKVYNKKLRKKADIPKGGSYKKFNQTWDIFDFRIYLCPKKRKHLISETRAKKMFKKIGRHQTWKLKK